MEPEEDPLIPKSVTINATSYELENENEDNIPLNEAQNSFRSFKDFTFNRDLRNSVYVMLATIFLQSMGFSIVLPSLWFYLEQKPKSIPASEWTSTSVSFLGYVVAIYSFGQFVGSPLFGWWSNRAPARWVVIVTLVVACCGNILYSIARDSFSSHMWRWVVFFARFIVGISAGNVAVCRAYCSHASNVNNRSKLMAWMSAAQGIGFGLGPAFSAAVGKIGFHVGNLYIDPYTSVGWLSAIFSLANAIALILIKFQELPHATVEASNQETTKSELKMIALILSLFFITIGVFSIFETMASVVLYHFYSWTQIQIGILFVGASFIGVAAYISVSLPAVTKRLSEKSLLLIGYALTVLSLLALPSWSFAGELVPPLGQFLVGTMVLSFAYPICTVELVILYSKVLHPKAQGTKMGWLTAAGSLSRMLCPIYASTVWVAAGSNISVRNACVRCNTIPGESNGSGSDASFSFSGSSSGSCDSSGSGSGSDSCCQLVNFCDSSVVLFFTTAAAVLLGGIVTAVLKNQLVPHPLNVQAAERARLKSETETPGK